MILKNLVIFTCILGLAACSSEKSTEVGYNNVAKNLGKAVLAKVKPKKKAPQTAKKAEGETLNRQMIVDSKAELLLVKLDRVGLYNLIQKSGQNGTHTTYRAPTNYTVTLDRGLITATRGLGLDLMAQGTNISIRSMFANRTKENTYIRKFRYLNTDSQLETTQFICIMSYEGQETINIIGLNYNTGKYLEQCQSEISYFENQYWVDRNTVTIWKSSQMIHPDLGTITVQKLN